MRKIIHIDMDAFFASIEQRDNPKWQGQPLAVGGKPEARGVVATASYEARHYGIRSAMPMAKAIRLCPRLIIVPTRGQLYREIAEEIRKIFFRFTDQVEPLSIDEAYLDVSDNYDFKGSATLLAQQILRIIYEETGLTASAGVSYCKFLAKYASNVNKPNGVFTISPAEAQCIIDAMNVEKIHGIGPATKKRLNAMGIFTGKELRLSDPQVLKKSLGKVADFYYRLARGDDEREVRISRERKSIGNERTFIQDIDQIDELWEKLRLLLIESWGMLREKGLVAFTVTVKIKYHDFNEHTKRYTESSPIENIVSAEVIAKSLLYRLRPNRPVRLIGVSFSQLVEKCHYPVQLRLFD